MLDSHMKELIQSTINICRGSNAEDIPSTSSSPLPTSLPASLLTLEPSEDKVSTHISNFHARNLEEGRNNEYASLYLRCHCSLCFRADQIHCPSQEYILPSLYIDSC